ncbi:MAG: dihydrofolate reductase family protein [Candidatus Aenigmarchaeota archaeon]|nr:dihydrofolate reductase family protein [Candidatus Aenigmarchaeota archaeon]
MKDKIVLKGFTEPNVPIEEMERFCKIEPEMIPFNRPYVWYMFVDTMDGRGSFLQKGKAGGYHVALGHFREDTGLAARYPDIAAGALADWRLLQYGWVVADAIMAASGILNNEPGNEWRVVDRDLIDYRQSLGKKPAIRVLVTGSGSLDVGEKVFSPQKEYETIVFTASEGENVLKRKAEEATGRLGYNPLDSNVRIYSLGEGRDITDFARMMEILRKTHGVQLLDLQGGPTLAGLLAAQKLIDEYRLTKAPHIIGDRYYNGGKARERPTAFTFSEGVSFGPDNSILTPSLAEDRQVGGHTFIRRKMVYRH